MTPNFTNIKTLKNMKTVMNTLTIFCLLAFTLASCSKSEAHILCTDYLRGEWVIKDWNPSGNDDGDLHYRYDADKNEMILSIVPSNPWGFEEGEVNIKDIDVENDDEFEAKIKLRYSNGDFEWIGVTMMVENENLIRTKMDCANCETLGSLERI